MSGIEEDLLSTLTPRQPSQATLPMGAAATVVASLGVHRLVETVMRRDIETTIIVVVATVVAVRGSAHQTVAIAMEVSTNLIIGIAQPLHKGCELEALRINCLCMHWVWLSRKQSNRYTRVTWYANV